MRTDTDLFWDIFDAIEAIEKYSSQGRERFVSDELIQVWIVHHLQIIGEACRAMPEKIQETEQSIPWKGIVGMRNILVHQYFSVDTDLLWETIINDLPILKKKIEKILRLY